MDPQLLELVSSDRMRRFPVESVFSPVTTMGGLCVLIIVTIANAALFVYARWQSWRQEKA
jgi:hypothetical protein